MADERPNIVEIMLAEVKAGKSGDYLENTRARVQNRAPDTPQGQRTREHEYDIAMGRRKNRE